LHPHPLNNYNINDLEQYKKTQAFVENFEIWNLNLKKINILEF
jgi:hypothetical protein